MRIESLNAGEYIQAREEAEALCEMVAEGGARATLIANLGLLNPAARTAAAEITVDCTKSLKTANGMGVETTLEEIQELHKRFGADLEITACGSISLAEQAIDFLAAGADRICTGIPFSIIAGVKTLAHHRVQEA
jgi:deoxyribose-phosphate aldolase